MKKVALVTLCAALMAMMALPAFAWEYKMKGDLEWRYRYWSRTGEKDIFGRMDPNDVNLGINHLLTYPTSGQQNPGDNNFGVLAGENNYGTDMSAVHYRMTVYPTIKVNKAIKIGASINLTSLGIWSDGEPYYAGRFNPPASPSSEGYINSLYVPIGGRPAAANVPNTFVTVQWLKTSIKTPMLDFSFGYKTSGLGIGLWKHKYSRSSSSFGVKAKYGPMTIGFSPYFNRRNSDWEQRGGRNEGDRSQQRKEYIRDYFRGGEFGFKYASGPMVIQIASDSYTEEGAPDTTVRGGALAPGKPERDTVRIRLHGSAKYFNGRFFANAEVDRFLRWRSGVNSATQPNGPVREGNNNDAWLYGAELGTIVGPSKVTVNYFRATGDDISTRETNEDAEAGETGISNGYAKDWAFLMYHMYGTGTNFDADGYGQPTNLHHLGGRVDFAAAANLNTFTIFSYAWRDTNAYTMGGDYQLGLRAFDNGDLQNWQLGAATLRPVVDDFIGWEVNLGYNWKLLENLTWSGLFAYWQPGDWWAHAYPDTAAIYRNNPGAAIAGADPAGRFAINPGRTIDPLIALQTNILINF